MRKRVKFNLVDLCYVENNFNQLCEKLENENLNVTRVNCGFYNYYTQLCEKPNKNKSLYTPIVIMGTNYEDL